MSLLIKNIEIIESNSTLNGQKVDILINDLGMIEKIGTISTTNEIVFDGTDKKVSIGWFDLKANFCDPGYEFKEDLSSGSKMAQNSGFTGVALLPETDPVIQTKNLVASIINFGKNQATELYPLAAVTTDLKNLEMTELLDLQKAGALAFSNGYHPISHAGLMVLLLQYLDPYQGLIIQKPEETKLTQHAYMNEGVSATYMGLKGMPNLAEEMAISRDLQLLEYAGGKIHFSSISTQKAVELIRNGKKQGLNVTCDVAYINLCKSDEELFKFDTNLKVNPPLRTQNDISALWQGLKDGTIDAICTDHNPQDIESKRLEFDQAEFGIGGMETFIAALLQSNQTLTLSELIEKISINPRKILSIDIPSIKEGNKANLCIFDTDLNWEVNHTSLSSKSKNNPYIGYQLKGKAIGVVNGKHQNLVKK